MFRLIKIILTLIGAVCVSALISPSIYWLVQEVGTSMFPWLKDVPFSRVFSRVLLICILLSMVSLLISLRISNLGELGLQKNRYWKRDVGWGFLLAAFPVVILMMAYVYFDVCWIREGNVEFPSLLRIIGTAVGVSLVEEVLFRGLLYGLSRCVFGAFISAVWTSALFAIVHFIHSSGPSIYPPDMWSGFREFSRFFGAIPPFPAFAFGLATLFCIGVLLCWAVEKTHSLALPIGLHIGWIFAIQTFNLFTKFQMQSPGALPWVGPHVVSGTVPVGIFAILAIAITFLLCWKYIHERPAEMASTKYS